mmetsp:Transcript_41081/g.113163  ORF Transcript_41081/g.113163 Transcript_41081/m.113163 type:complete len:617 (-) Transcript_41081:143-1993(-)
MASARWGTRLTPSSEPGTQESLKSGQSAHSGGSTGTSQVGLQHALERRMEWLEEDIGVTQRRLRDTFGLGPGGGCKEGAPGVASLQAIALRLEAELAEERRWRDGLEAQVAQMEESLRLERANRGEALQRVSAEFGDTLKGLVDRIDTGLAEETRLLNLRASATEKALQDLVTRVERGLASGTKPLNLAGTGGSSASGGGASGDDGPSDGFAKVVSFAAPPWGNGKCEVVGSTAPAPGSTLANPDLAASISSGRIRSDAVAAAAVSGATAATRAAMNCEANEPRPNPISTRDPALSPDGTSTLLVVPTTALPDGNTNVAAKIVEATEPLLKAWGELQEENIRLLQRRKQLNDQQSLGYPRAASKQVIVGAVDASQALGGGATADGLAATPGEDQTLQGRFRGSSHEPLVRRTAQIDVNVGVGTTANRGGGRSLSPMYYHGRAPLGPGAVDGGNLDGTLGSINMPMASVAEAAQRPAAGATAAVSSVATPAIPVPKRTPTSLNGSPHLQQQQQQQPRSQQTTRHSQLQKRVPATESFRFGPNPVGPLGTAVPMRQAVISPLTRPSAAPTLANQGQRAQVSRGVAKTAAASPQNTHNFVQRGVPVSRITAAGVFAGNA